MCICLYVYVFVSHIYILIFSRRLVVIDCPPPLTSQHIQDKPKASSEEQEVSAGSQ